MANNSIVHYCPIIAHLLIFAILFPSVWSVALKEHKKNPQKTKWPGVNYSVVV